MFRDTAIPLSDVYKKLRDACEIKTVIEITNQLDNLIVESLLFRLARQTGDDQRPEIAAMREAEDFDIELYREALYNALTGGIPHLDFDMSSDYSIYIEPQGLNQFSWDDVDEILSGGGYDSSLMTFIIWICSDYDDAEQFSTICENFEWPFVEMIHTGHFPKKETVIRRLKKMGIFDILFPIIPLFLYPEDNPFLTDSYEHGEGSYDLDLENIDYLRAEYAKIDGYLDKLITAENDVARQPMLLAGLAEALEAKTEDGKRFRISSLTGDRSKYEFTLAEEERIRIKV